MPFGKRSGAYRPRPRRSAPRRLRQYSAQSSPLDLSLEGKNRISNRSFADNKNLAPQVPRSPSRNKASAQLRSSRNHCLAHRRRLRRLSFLAGGIRRSTKKALTDHANPLQACAFFARRSPITRINFRLRRTRKSQYLIGIRSEEHTSELQSQF